MALGACGANPSKSKTPVTVAAAPKVGPWQLLARGELKRAEEAFAALSETRRQEALAGTFRLAQLRSDWKATTGLAATLAALPAKNRELRLVVSAAEALLALPRKLEPKELAICDEACRRGNPKASSGGKSEEGSSSLAVRAEGACSRLAVRKAHPQLDRCVKGCETPLELPLTFVSNAPAVRLSVAGQPPALFILDTGASVSVLTQDFVSKAGLKAVAGSAFRINSPAGLRKATRTVSTLRIGDANAGLALEAVPFTILSLPLGGVAGIISPHATLRGFAVTLDLRRQRLRIARRPTLAKGLATLPLILGNGNPTLSVKLGDRPRRPLYLDTGAYRTSLTTALDRLGTPLRRLGATRIAGAGGGKALAYSTRATLPASADGGLRWTVVDPVLFVKGDAERYRDIKSAGLLGMDFLMGRVLVIDSPRRAIQLSREATLGAWPVGASQRILVYDAKGSRGTIDERVVSRKGAMVELQVALSLKARNKGAPEQIVVRLADSWAARGSWMLTRPAKGAWRLQGDKRQKLGPKALVGAWLPFFHPFGTQGKNPRISQKTLGYGKEKLDCARVGVDAMTKSGPARLTIDECPTLPWRTVRVELRGAGGKLLWGFRHAQLADD